MNHTGNYFQMQKVKSIFKIYFYDDLLTLDLRSQDSSHYRNKMMQLICCQAKLITSCLQAEEIRESFLRII